MDTIRVPASDAAPVPLRVAVATLGCKVNFCDSQAVAGLFRDRGYSIVEFADEADVYIINTCSVTSIAARKSRQLIRRARRSSPEALVVAMGCYAQYAPDQVSAIEGVDVLVGTQPRAQIVDLVEEATRTGGQVNAVGKVMSFRQYEELAATYSESRARAIVKVQDGCDEYCSYCQIPRVRGRSRSRLPGHVVEQAYRLVEQGYKEITLTGVHLGAYGQDLAAPTSLVALVRAVAQVPGLTRVRISSIDPHEVHEELIETIAANPNICRHLHIPAQAGEDTVLRAMRRRNTASEYCQLVDRLRRMIPGVSITTDIIVGFPGESDTSFATTAAFCARMAFSKIHVFPYSRRSGTRAASFSNHVASEVKRQRTQRLIALSDQLALAYHRSLLGSHVAVLLEGPSREHSGFLEGLTDTYVRVHVPAGRGAVPGELAMVEPSEADRHGLKGRLVP